MARLYPPASEVRFDRASDKAYEQLRRLIISLDLEPGTVLVESALLERLGCGRTPLREALQRLHEDGLVVAVPRRAVSVADITVSGLRQLYEARWELEPILGRLAARRMTAEERVALDRQLGARPGGGPNSSYDVTEWDMAFHRALARAADNRYLFAAFERLEGVAQRLLVFAYRRGPFLPPTLEEHQAIRDALRDGDPDRVAARLQEHIRNAKDRILRTV